MKKMLFSVMSLMLVSSVALTGCSSNPGDAASPAASKEASESQAGKPVEITFRHALIGERRQKTLDITMQAIKKMEKEVPGLKVKLDGVDGEVNRKDKIRGEMASGRVPEIFDAFGSPDVKMFAKEGKVLDITPILTELGIKDKFTNLEAWTLDGKVYGLPMAAGAEGVYYNKAYFEAKGLKVPQTYDELITLMEKIKADGKIPFSGASKSAWIPLMLTNQIWSRLAGPDVTSKFSTGKAKWTDPAVTEAFRVHKDWVNQGYFKKAQLGLEYADYNTQFINGESVMMFDGSWAASLFQEGGAGVGMASKVGFFNFPSMSKGVGDQTSLMQDMNNGYAFSADVAKDPQKMAAVKSFIKNFYTEDMQMQFLVQMGSLPCMKLDEAKVKASVKDPLLLEIMSVLLHSTSSYSAFDALVSADVTTEIGTQIQKLIDNKTTPEAAAASIQKVQDEANADAK
ncbi:ABC transporter substrate-binding protein [Paenibacillus pectinilyticus]|uniref:ABC transporter substrate-binding protein n=1 Tax=Paenibacillus pectinilyticus TaxID=512399 RepID=A0A1C0ZRN3_9BACL|nr:extracellular solute-binding protein [Paenibacillus pectinilyticus]OCT10727.1 ABC transporter substrate-binding protein [Paenibacillus pectinilyticus]